MSGSRSWQAGRRPDGRQAEWARRTGRRSLEQSRRSSTAKLAAAILGLAALVAVGAVLISRYQPISQPALAVVGDPLYRDLELPPNAGADQGHHIDLVRLKDDAGYLFAPVAEPSAQDWNLLTADRLLRETRERVIDLSRGLPSDERSIVIYCGLLGMCRDGKAMLLVSDESGSDLQIPADEWIRSLSAAAQETGTRVLMLIDPGPATISWSQGILAPDFATQLKSELAEQPLSNVCVMVASGPGETSWRITDLAPPTKESEEDTKTAAPSEEPTEPHELGRSVFSCYIVSGLRGQGVDRSGRAIGTADHGPSGNRDGRITADELFAFVREKVDRWATSQRGMHQTVMKFGGDGDFLVGAVTKPPTESKEQKPVEESPADDSKSGEKVAAGKGNTPKKPQEPPAVAAERRLAQLWLERDRLAASSPPPYVLAPAEWQAFQARLLAAEQRLRIGLADAALKRLSEAEEQLASIATTADATNLGKNFGGTWYRPFLSGMPDQPPAKPTSPATAANATDGATPPQAPTDVAAMLEAAVKVPATMPIPNEQAIRDQLADRNSFSKGLDWAVEKGSSAQSVDDWTGLGRMAALFPHADQSPELTTIQRLAAASRDGASTDGNSRATLAGRVLRMFVDFGRIGLDDPASLSMLRRQLADGLLATAAAERWLVLAGDTEEAERQLRRADSILRNLQQSATAISDARQLRQQLDEQLPQLAAWLASVRETEPKLSSEDDRYVLLQSLSDELNALATHATSPESNWGALQSRIDTAWTVSKIDDASGIGADLTTLVFGERRLATLLDQLANAGAGTPDRAANEFRLRETVAALEALPLGVSNAIADLVSQPSWADIDRQLRYTSLPGLNVERRQQLREALQTGQYSTSGGALSSDLPRWVAGTWQGFWARQILNPIVTGEATGDSVPERSGQFDRVWGEFLESVKNDESENIVSRRAAMGSAIQFLTEDRNRTLGGTPSGDANEVPVLLGLFADASSLAGESIDFRKSWSSLPAGMRPAAETGPPLIARELGGTLSDNDSVIADSGPRGATLSLRSFPQRGHLSLRTGQASNPVDVFLAEQRLQNGDIPADASDPQPVVRFRSELTGEESVIVALVDVDQFPLAIQRVRVIPEIGEERWRIRFAVATNRSEVLPDAPEVLSLPPQTGKPLSLVPILEFPAAAPAESVSVEVQQRDSAVAENWRTVLGPKEFAVRKDANSVISGDLRRLVLDFSPAPMAQPAAPAETPGAAVSGSTGFSFVNGLRFVIRLDGKDLPPREIWPVTFEANRFVSEEARELGIGFQGDPPRIEALITATRSVDPRIPESVPIELEFDRRLDPLVGEQKATKGFVSPANGGTLRLFGQIGDTPGFETLLNSTGGSVALNVAGIPRAYRWRLRRGQVPDRIQPNERPLELEFVRRTPAAGAPAASGVAPSSTLEVVPVEPTLDAAMIDAKELGNVSLRYYIYQFDDQANALEIAQPRPRSIVVRRSEPGRQDTSQVFYGDEIIRRFATRMNATVTGAVWSVSVESEPHSAPLNFSAIGRFEVTTVLREPGKADVTSDPIRLVIDGTPPLVPRFLSPTKDQPASADRPLPVVCATSDAESGLRSLELRIDADGSGAFEPEKDAVKRFAEADLATGPGDPWYDIGEVKVRWDVPVELLPPAPAAGKLDRVTIWAVAENRQGISAEAPPYRLELKRTKPKPPPPPPTTGDIVVTVKPKPRPAVEPEIVLVGPDGSTESRTGTSTKFSKLKPGQYEIRVTQGSTGFKGQGEAKVTVEAGKTATADIQVK